MPSLIWKLRINHSKLRTNANTCPVCKKIFPTPANLKCHLRIHTLEKPFECSECGKCFNQVYNLHRHELLHSGKKPHTCKECGKSFRLKTHLKIHRFTHTGESPYKCEICGKKFGQGSALKYHMLIHTGERPHMCDICGKSFNQQASLSMHKAIHGDVEYECTECGKSFKFKSNLLEHKRSKHEGKFVSCEVCGKKFSYKSNLKKHMVSHNYLKKTTEEFQCFDCNRVFSQKANLANHVANIHTRSNTKECAICVQSFTNKYSLERHLVRFHMNDKTKKYTCSACFKRFKFLSSLKRHRISYCPKKPIKRTVPKMKSEEPSLNLEKIECPIEEMVEETPEYVEIFKPEECTEISYECDVCHQILGSPESLDVHLISHTPKEIKNAESKKKLSASPKNVVKVKLPTPIKKVVKIDESTKNGEGSSDCVDTNETLKSPSKNNKEVSSPSNNSTPKSVKKRNRFTPSKYSTIVNSTSIEDDEEEEKQLKEMKNEETKQELKKHFVSSAKEKNARPSIVKPPPKTPSPMKINKCKICDKNFDDIDALKAHFFTHRKEEMFMLLCGIDEKADENSSIEETPMGVARKKKNVSFTVPDKNSVSSENTKIPTIKHEKRTLPASVFSCGMCDAKFTTLYSQKRHEKSYCRKNPVKTLTCIICKQDFPDCDLEKHQSCHKTAQNETDISVTTPSKFKKHMCECGRKFPTEFSLRKHRKRFCSLNTEKSKTEQESPLDLTKPVYDVCKDTTPPRTNELQNHPQTDQEKPRKNSRKNYKVNRIIRRT